MRRMGITGKLFALLVVFFVLFLSLALYLETVFFENFYQERKGESLDNAMAGFISTYENGNWSEGQLKNRTFSFEQTHNVRMAIVDADNNILNEQEYSITVQDYSGRTFVVPLNAILTVEDMGRLKGWTKDDIIEVEGDILISDEEDAPSRLSPVRVAIDGANLVNLKAAYGYEGGYDTLDKISGTILEASLPEDQDMYRGLNSPQLWSIVDYWYNEEFSPKQGDLPPSRRDQVNRPSTFVYHDPRSGEQLLVRSYQMEVQGTTQYALLVGSRVPILEAVETLKDYFVYVILVAVGMIVLVAYVFSLLVSKPLIRVNEAAKQMAKLEFGTYLEVRSDDEIGSLSASLNSLSMNLQRSLEDLHKANLKLQRDIERERQIEHMRKQFVSGFSHELKTPIGIIKGFAEGIRDGIAEGREERFVNVILGEVDKLDALVLDMLELSKMQSEQYRLEKSKFSLKELMKRVVGKFDPQLQEKDLHIQPYIQETVCSMVHGDKRRIEQVLTNVLSNAIRHARPGSDLTIGLSGRRGQLHVFIENEGSPIPEEEIPKLWERFYRVDAARTKSSGGTGLGLAIVKNILELHGADFGIINTEKGVRFYFDLTCADQKEGAE